MAARARATSTIHEYSAYKRHSSGRSWLVVGVILAESRGYLAVRKFWVLGRWRPAWQNGEKRWIFLSKKINHLSTTMTRVRPIPPMYHA